jgi:hypothetical protein
VQSLAILVALGVLALPLVALVSAFAASGRVERWHQRLDGIERDAAALKRRLRELQHGRA